MQRFAQGVHQSTPLTPRTQRGVRLTDTGLIPVEGEKAKSGKGKGTEGSGVQRKLGTSFQKSSPSTHMLSLAVSYYSVK